MQFSSWRHWLSPALIGLFSVCFIAACGGSSGDDGGSDGGLYINAGADREVAEQSETSLTASVSGGDGSVTYRWSVSPALPITHPDNSLADASFTAPIVTEQTVYTFTVSASNDTGNTATDTVVITVVPDNALPVADVQVPQWDGLASNHFPAGVVVTLDGTASTDADSSNAQSPISDWHWQQTEGTNVIADVVTNQPTLTFTTPIANAAQTINFELTVTDEEGASDTKLVAINVQSASETLPVVDAGLNQGVFSGEPILLIGEASTTVPSANPLQVLWVPDGQLDLTVQEEDDLSTFAIAPQVESETEITITLQVTDANNNRVEELITVAVRPMPTPLLNDTGITIQATDDDITETQQNDFPGQDGQRGLDVVAKNGLIEKSGRGLAGFDLTKLDSNGDEQDDTDADWSCVRDNVTGLVWEVKTDDGDLRDKDNLFAWYYTENNGGFVGDLHNSDTVCTLTECNTETYQVYMNENGLCGFYDWRLPTHDELMSLVHFGVVDGPMLDTDYFPNTGDFNASPIWYWTRQPGADGVQDDRAQNAWAIDFASGVDNFLNKSSAVRIRLVRAGR